MIARRSLWVVGNSILGGMMGYVALFAMARYMGDELVGARAYALSIAFLLGAVARLGFPTTHARRLGRGDDIAGSNGTYLAMKMGLTVAFVILSSTVLWIWFHVLGRAATDITETALWIGVIIVLTKSLRDFVTNTFRGLGRIMQRESMLFTNTAITVGLTLLAALAYAHGAGRWTPLPGLAAWMADALAVTGPVPFPQALTWLMAAYLAGEVGALVLGWILFLRHRIPVAAPSAAIARDYVRATIPIMFVTLAGLLMRRIDQVMIGFWRDNSELGHYAAATKITEIVLILAAGIQVVLLPVISHLHKADRIVELRAVLIASERWISLLVWPVVLLGITFTAPLIHILLSDAFLAAVPLFVILLFSSLLNSLTIPLRTKALGLGEQGFAARSAIIAVSVNIVLNLFLIPDQVGPLPGAGLGAVGASYATLAAGVLLIALYRERAHDWTRHPYISHHLVRHIVAAAATYAWLWLMRPILPAVERFYDLLWLGPFVLVSYLIAVAMAGDLHRDDWRQARRLFGDPRQEGP